MNKKSSFFPGLIFLIVGLCLVLAHPAFAVGRSKSAVLTVYQNNSGTTYNEDLDQIVKAELQKRLEGLYIELDGDPYKHLFKEISIEEKTGGEITELVKKSGADYLIYLDMYPFKKGENYNLVYHRRSMTATVLLWIINLNSSETLFKDHFSLKEKDETDAWFIGNKSVAKKAVKTTMYKVGEIISAKLPL